MRAGAHAITIEAQIILSRRELAVLNHICSYDHSKHFEGLRSTHYEGGVSREEMVELMTNLRTETQTLMNRLQSSKEQLFGSKCANIPATLSDTQDASKLTH